MITRAMTRLEVKQHLICEYNSSIKQINARVALELWKLRYKSISSSYYNQKVKSGTQFQIHVLDSGEGDYIIGAWNTSDEGWEFAQLGCNDVNFYSANFFKRFCGQQKLVTNWPLNKCVNRFFVDHPSRAFVRKQTILSEGVFEIEVHYENGIGFGFCDDNHSITVQNEYVNRWYLTEPQLDRFKETAQLRRSVEQKLLDTETAQTLLSNCHPN